MKKIGRPAIKIELKDKVEAIKSAYKRTKCVIEQRRLQALCWLAEGKSREEVLQLSGYTKSSLVTIIKAYNEKGLSGLKDKRHQNPGRPNLLSDQEMLVLAQAIRKDYEKGIYWKGTKLLSWLKEELGKEVYEQRAYEYLKAVGMSQQSPRPYHAKADPVKQEQFKKNST